MTRAWKLIYVPEFGDAIQFGTWESSDRADCLSAMIRAFPMFDLILTETYEVRISKRKCESPLTIVN